MFPATLDLYNGVGPNVLVPNSEGESHALIHEQIRRAIYAVQTKLGIDGSADPDSIDFRLSQFVNAKTQGAVGDNVANDTAALQSAIDLVASAGGGTVFVPPGTYKVTATLTLPAQGRVKICGAGSGYQKSNAGPVAYSATTTISAAASMTAVFRASATDGGSKTCDDVQISGLCILCNGVAGKAIDLLTVCQSKFSNLLIYNPTVGGISINVVSSLVGGDANATQQNQFRDICIQIISASNTAYGIKLDGNIGANSAFNRFDGIYVRHGAGPGIDCAQCDTNCFTFIRTMSTGVGFGMVFRKDPTNNNLFARHNTVFGIECQPINGGVGGMKFEGDGVGNDSDANVVYGYAMDNGAPAPTFESNCRNEVYTTTGVHYVGRPTKLTAGTTNVLQIGKQIEVNVDTSGGAVVLNSLQNGVDRQRVSFFSFGASTFTVVNNSVTGSQKIFTKSGNDIVVLKGVVTLVCDGTSWYEV